MMKRDIGMLAPFLYNKGGGVGLRHSNGLEFFAQNAADRFLDESGSMLQCNRAQAQAALVERIALVATRLVPEGERVDLRFINNSGDSQGVREQMEALGITKGRDRERHGEERVCAALVYHPLLATLSVQLILGCSCFRHYLLPSSKRGQTRGVSSIGSEEEACHPPFCPSVCPAVPGFRTRLGLLVAIHSVSQRFCLDQYTAGPGSCLAVTQRFGWASDVLVSKDRSFHLAVLPAHSWLCLKTAVRLGRLLLMLARR
jgi:hypothetical protein